MIFAVLSCPLNISGCCQIGILKWLGTPSEAIVVKIQQSWEKDLTCIISVRMVSKNAPGIPAASYIYIYTDRQEPERDKKR